LRTGVSEGPKRNSNGGNHREGRVKGKILDKGGDNLPGF